MYKCIGEDVQAKIAELGNERNERTIKKELLASCKGKPQGNGKSVEKDSKS